jgi:methylenetetrahydrofolate dehydrogenase (NAD+)
MSKDPSHPCKVVLAGHVAKGLLAEVQAGLSQLGRKPHLLGVLANSDPAAKVYADWTEKTCREK